MPVEIQYPIFIVGCPRSGTTLLQQMLDAHPDIAIAPETFFIRNFWLQRKHYGDLNQDSNYRQLIKDIVDLPEFQEMKLNSGEFSEIAWNSTRDYPSIFKLLLRQFAQQKKVKIVGEKTPNHLLYMETLEQFFPSARFIHIVRDPRAVVKSWQKVPWTNGSLAGDAKVWRRYMATARLCANSVKSSLFTLYYEKLVTAPEENLKNLCRFLNIEFDSAMICYHHQDSLTVNIAREPWKADAKKPLTQALLNTWQTELSTQMISDIEIVVWSEMKHLGYKTQTAPIQILWQQGLAAVKRKCIHLINIFKQSILWQTK